jgi:four helix bundle protein
MSSHTRGEGELMLKIYPFILETLKMVAPLLRQIEKRDFDLAKQLRRAASSIALNTAEAVGVRGGNERLRFLTALGSTQEVRACLDVAETFEYVETINALLRDRLDRIAATLYRLSR